MKKTFTYLCVAVMLQAFAFTAAAESIDPQLVGRWSFNDGTANDSVGTADGTVYGAVIANGRVAFDGMDDVVVTSPISSLNTDEISIVAWCSLDAIDRFMGMAYLTQNSDFAIPGTGNSPTIADEELTGIAIGERTLNQIMVASNFWHRTIENNGGPLVTSEYLGTDVMVTVCSGVSESNGSALAIYVNGVPYASYETAYPQVTFDTASGAHMLLGRHMNAANSAACFDGSIDEVRLYDDVLSPAKIAEMYTLGPDTLAVPEPTVFLLILSVLAMLPILRRNKR